MKKLLLFLGALALQSQTVSVSDTLTNAVGGGSWTGERRLLLPCSIVDDVADASLYDSIRGSELLITDPFAF